MSADRFVRFGAMPSIRALRKALIDGVGKENMLELRCAFDARYFFMHANTPHMVLQQRRSRHMAPVSSDAVQECIDILDEVCMNARCQPCPKRRIAILHHAAQCMYSAFSGEEHHIKALRLRVP